MFKTENIYLRKIESSDAEIYHEWRNNPEIMRSTSPYLDLYTLEETESFINMIASQPSAKGYMIIYNETHATVGIISLVNIDTKNRSAECIIDIGDKSVWGKGIGTQALSLVIDYAFNELNMHRVYLQVFSFNERAIGLYQKLGFIEEGRLREALYRDGNWHDIVQMSILKSEYKNKAKE